MSKTKAVIGLCLLFFFGVVTGVALSVRITDLRMRQLAAGGPETLSDVVVRRLGQKLALTPVQRDQVRQIATETEVQIQTIQSRILPETNAVAGSAIEKIRAVLTPEQIAPFNELVEHGEALNAKATAAKR